MTEQHDMLQSRRWSLAHRYILSTWRRKDELPLRHVCHNFFSTYVLFLLFAQSSAQYTKGSLKYENQRAVGEKDLRDSLKSHPDVTNHFFLDREAADCYNTYRVASM